MVKPNYDFAAIEAKRILEENFITEPPVLAYELAENYGLKVTVAEFDDENVSGMLDISERKIIVNRKESIARHSFTIAHELGHWILHVKSGALKDDFEVLYRKPLGIHEDNWMEKEANWFAANLLVPAQMLKKFESISQEDAARIFQVSPSVNRINDITEKHHTYKKGLQLKEGFSTIKSIAITIITTIATTIAVSLLCIK